MIGAAQMTGPTPPPPFPPALLAQGPGGGNGGGQGGGRDGDRTGGRPSRGWPLFHRVLPAEPAAIQRTLLCLRERFAAETGGDQLARVELVLAEVMNNVAQHGTGRGKIPDPARPGLALTIHLSVAAHEGGLACAVTDDGPPLPPACLAAGREPITPEMAALAAGGFGWIIIRDLAQSLFHFREGPRNVLCFNIPRDARLTPASRPDVA